MQRARRRMAWWFSLTGFGIRPGTGGGDRSSSVWGGGRGLAKKRRGRERQEGCCWRRSAQWMDSASSGLVRRGSHGTGKVPQRKQLVKIQPSVGAESAGRTEYGPSTYRCLD